MKTQSTDKILIAIPAYNESDTIVNIIKETHDTMPEATIIVIDDGSTDNTATLAKTTPVIILEMPFNVGVGGAMRTAFLYASQYNYDYVVQVDADGQHNPQEIPKLITAMKNGSNIAIGARFAGDDEYKVKGARKLAMITLSKGLTKITKEPLTDTTSGFRGADKKAIQLFAQHYPSEYLGDTVESLVIASRAGLTITQTPVHMNPRQGGTPSQNTIKSILYLGRAWLALGIALTRKPVADMRTEADFR